MCSSRWTQQQQQRSAHLTNGFTTEPVSTPLAHTHVLMSTLAELLGTHPARHNTSFRCTCTKRLAIVGLVRSRRQSCPRVGMQAAAACLTSPPLLVLVNRLDSFDHSTTLDRLDLLDHHFSQCTLTLNYLTHFNTSKWT